MSEYYKAKRTRNVFDPQDPKPFKLSRSKLDLFLSCQRCFYLDRRLGVSRPPGFPFSLNSAVDALLKKEFDLHRAKETAHPLMKKYNIDAVPFQDARMDEWRDSLRRGIQYLHPKANLILSGGVDDIWVHPVKSSEAGAEQFHGVNPQGELMIVDYKATSKTGEVGLDADWQIGYKRQMEIYQWLFRMNGFKVSKIGYFVYCNGDTDKAAFDGKLEFDVKVIPYEGDDSWVEKALLDAHRCLMDDNIPKAAPDCDYCAYVAAAKDAGK